MKMMVSELYKVVPDSQLIRLEARGKVLLTTPLELRYNEDYNFYAVASIVAVDDSILEVSI